MRILSPGERFAGCRIVSLCGRGGLGVVYLALDAMNRKVALKLITAPDSERELHGIREYIRVAENEKHLIRIFHAGIENNELYYIMEAADPLDTVRTGYIPKTLSNLLAQEGKLAPDAALKLVRELASGLEVLHRAKLIHRDVKPENIIFVNGVPKLCDPGLVCSFEGSASLAGTLGYLPPECFDGRNLCNPSRDIYALGKVLYTAITGEPPAHCPRLPHSIGIAVGRKIWPVLSRVCGGNVKRRLQSTTEFLAILPVSLPQPTVFDRQRENLRMWRIVHPTAWRGVLLASGTLILGGILAFGICARHRRDRERFESDCQKHANVFLEKFYRNRSNLLLQIENLRGTRETARIREQLRVLPVSPEKRLEICRSLEQRFAQLAQDAVPALPKKTSLGHAFAISGQTRSLLASPLGEWLSPKLHVQTSKALGQWEKTNILPFCGRLRPGASFAPDSSFRMNFIYVPPGCFRSAENGIVRVDHPFWVCDGELRSDYFYIRYPDRARSNPDMPANLFVWNELIDFCRFLTLSFHATGVIPKSHIVRPLTGPEWSWACRGAWSGPGKASSFLKKNSGRRLHPIRRTEPNSLGLFDMIGNVAEMTVPERHGNNSVDIRGGHYLAANADADAVAPYPLYQFLPPFVGTRLAVGPGDMEFFEREFRTEDALVLQSGPIRYELLACNNALFDQEDSKRIVELLGGALAVVDSPELLASLRNTFPELNDFPISVGWRYENGRWLRPDGKPFRLPMPPPPKTAKWILGLKGRGFEMQMRARNPGILCQWDATQWENRKNVTRIKNSSVVLHSFSLDGRTFCLVKIAAQPHTARRIAALLGARLAIPGKEAFQNRLRKELDPWREYDILTDGRWKFESWKFSDGTETLRNTEQKGRIYNASRYLSSLGFHDGAFCELQESTALLLELPPFVEETNSAASGSARKIERSVRRQR